MKKARKGQWNIENLTVRDVPRSLRAGSLTSGAVSYTHLDVYKRQGNQSLMLLNMGRVTAQQGYPGYIPRHLRGKQRSLPHVPSPRNLVTGKHTRRLSRIDPGPRTRNAPPEANKAPEALGQIFLPRR